MTFYRLHANNPAMARPLRVEYDGALYHVVSRANAKEPIFAPGSEKGLLLDTLSGVNKKFNWICHAYCVMDNHYHLLIETPDGNLSKGMRGLNGIYTQAFNRRKNRVGHVFQGRYKAILVQKESYLLEVARYVVLNPVRAKTAKSAADFQWSSYRATMELDEPHDCLTTSWILGQFHERKEQAQTDYAAFVAQGRDRQDQSLANQVVLGNPNFIDDIAKRLKQPELLDEVPRRQRFLHRPSLATLFSGAGNRKNRNRIIHDAVYSWGYDQKEVGDQLGLHPSTISRLLSGKRRSAKMSRLKT